MGNMDSARREEAWKQFWAREQTASVHAIVSSEWSAISEAQFKAWGGFADGLATDAHVLDVATGSGKLLEILRAWRSDLTAVGVDIAERLPVAPHGIELIGGISMEKLPFQADAFDAVVSQFGFEYGDAAAAAEEILRVLRPEGRIGLMVHRGDGPILAHNRRREEQIRWVKDDNALFARVLSLLPADNSLARDAIELAQALAQQGAQQFGQGSAAWEIPEAVRRTLILGPRASRERLLESLALISDQADNELGRISSLAQACANADDRENLLASFRSAGREAVSTVAIQLPGEHPFADLVIL